MRHVIKKFLNNMFHIWLVPRIEGLKSGKTIQFVYINYIVSFRKLFIP